MIPDRPATNGAFVQIAVRIGNHFTPWWSTLEARENDVASLPHRDRHELDRMTSGTGAANFRNGLSLRFFALKIQCWS